MAYGIPTWDLTDLDIEAYPVWVRDAAHCEPVFTPLYTPYWHHYLSCAENRAAELLQVPRSRAFHYRIFNGHGYCTVAMPPEAEIPQREVRYRELMAPIFDDPFGYVDTRCAEAAKWINPLVPLKVEEMPLDVLATHFIDIQNMMAKCCWEYFLGWYGNCSAVGLFHQIAEELTGLKNTDPLYTTLVTGIDNMLYRSNADLATLATRAMELKVDNNLKLSDEEIIPTMGQSDTGREWLKALDGFINAHGLRLLRIYEICEPGWYEKPSMVLPAVRRYAEVGGVHRADTERERLTKEREEATKEFLAKVPIEQRDMMHKLLVYTQGANYLSEEGAYQIELKRHALTRRCLVECGKRIASAGVIEQPDDVFMLFPDEVLKVLIPQEKGRYVSLVQERRQEWEHYKKISHTDEVPFCFGDPNLIGDLIMRDPTFSVSVSVPIATPEEVRATCVGGAGAPGVVEGVARLIMDESQWGQVQSGDIMVCPMTSAPWTPLFGIINGLVCDSGGALSHPAIVSREYGIPAVVGTRDATRKIKTGDKIRVDGNLLRVYVL